MKTGDNIMTIKPTPCCNVGVFGTVSKVVDPTPQRIKLDCFLCGSPLDHHEFIRVSYKGTHRWLDKNRVVNLSDVDVEE